MSACLWKATVLSFVHLYPKFLHQQISGAEKKYHLSFWFMNYDSWEILKRFSDGCIRDVYDVINIWICLCFRFFFCFAMWLCSKCPLSWFIFCVCFARQWYFLYVCNVWIWHLILELDHHFSAVVTTRCTRELKNMFFVSLSRWLCCFCDQILFAVFSIMPYYYCACLICL